MQENRLKFECKNSSRSELHARDRIQNILERFDLSKYTFTQEIIIEDRAIPHSHPVLTLNSFPYNDENIILETFIHEQLHWYLESLPRKLAEAVTELKKQYPKAPWGFPLGCVDQNSTYEHLILCRLSHKIMRKLIGNDDASKVLYYLQNHHYLWVYETIQKDSEYLDSILDKYELGRLLDKNS